MALSRQAAEQIYDSGKEATVQWMLQIDAKVDELIEKVAKLSKNSSNSSKPPSSDITKPNRAERRRDQKKLKRGGQLGHEKWERDLFGEDEVTPIDYRLNACPQCNTPLVLLPDEPVRKLQQAEIVTPSVSKIEHRSYGYWCPKCKCTHYAPFPGNVVKEGLFKAHLSSTVCFLKFVGCMSLSGIKNYLKDALDISVTKGYLVKIIQKGAKALEPCYNELLKQLPSQPVVNSDETGHKENGENLWTWVFRSNLFALFKISPSRGSDVLIDVLGKEFNGALGCDYFSAYRKYMTDFNVSVQFCLAHLIRDVKYLVDYPDAAVKRYGTKILDTLRDLFHVIHSKDKMTSEKFASDLDKRKAAVVKAATGYVPNRSLAENIAKRFRENGDAFFTFITTPQIDPTNNCAEQAIRFVVIYRKVTQGTRSEKGRAACERFFTVAATCAMQGRSVYAFIKDAFERYFQSLPPPSLLPAINTA